MKKFCRLLLLCVLAFSLAGESLASAVVVSPTPPTTSSTPPVVITSVVGSGVFTDSAAVEIFNQTGAPINLAGWRVDFGVTDSCGTALATQNLDDGWLLPTRYQTVEADIARSGCSGAWLNSAVIFNGQTAVQTVIIPTATSLPAGKIAQHKQRSNTSSTRTVSDSFTVDYPKIIDASTATLFNDEPYQPPVSSGGLQILEILPHSRDCSPSDNTSPDCTDYVKLYNPTSTPVDMSQYRLRIGYKGQGISVTNTFHFGQMLAPGKYFTLATRDDGGALSITDSGNFIWIEDTEGVKMYEPVIQYPDASSTTKVSQAWAFDGTGWRWTSAPHPFDANYFPPEAPAEPAPGSETTLKPCAADQYRNPLTNRCRLLATTSSLTPCRSDQARNPETNRCRSVLATLSGLQPCKAGQVRNPATNRCKSIITASSSLKPCQPGWERNPETNRCRKGAVLGDTTAKVQDVRVPTAADHTRWLLAGIAIIGALAYAAYEWRQELGLKFAGAATITSKLTKFKK